MTQLSDKKPRPESWELQIGSETHLVERKAYTDLRVVSMARKWATSVVYRCISTNPSSIAGVVVSAGLWENRFAPGQSNMETTAQARMLKVFNKLRDSSTKHLRND